MLALFHFNIASVQKHKEELETILNMINLTFDVMGLTESKIRKSIDQITNFIFDGYILNTLKQEREEYCYMLHIA